MNLQEETNKKKSKNNYTKFVIMLAGSFIAMYITMYLIRTQLIMSILVLHAFT